MPKSNIGPLIDEYGLIQAQIADLKLKAEPIYEQIKAMGAGSYEGDFYRATVSEYEQSKLDMKAARAKLSRQFIKANTTKTPVTKVTVSGRTAENVKEVA